MVLSNGLPPGWVSSVLGRPASRRRVVTPWACFEALGPPRCCGAWASVIHSALGTDCSWVKPLPRIMCTWYLKMSLRDLGSDKLSRFLVFRRDLEPLVVWRP